MHDRICARDTGGSGSFNDQLFEMLSDGGVSHSVVFVAGRSDGQSLSDLAGSLPEYDTGPKLQSSGRPLRYLTFVMAF